MASLNDKFNPRANIFLLLNLGCEMVYVIDQRLKAQHVALDKSHQVIHDITAVLLDPKFLDSLIIGSSKSGGQLFTEEQCKFILKDIATCSLMRLNENSMDKLWNLMTMIYKWQLFLTRHHHHLLDITFRHLNSIGELHAKEQSLLLIDFTKNTLLDFWNSCTDHQQVSIYKTNKAWLEFFNTKISLLVRLGFQSLDGMFVEQVPHTYFLDYRDSLGENIYEKSLELANRRKIEISSTFNCLQHLAEILHTNATTNRMLNHNIPKNFTPLVLMNLNESKTQKCDKTQTVSVEGTKSPMVKLGIDCPSSKLNEFIPVQIKHNKNSI